MTLKWPVACLRRAIFSGAPHCRPVTFPDLESKPMKAARHHALVLLTALACLGCQKGPETPQVAHAAGTPAADPQALQSFRKQLQGLVPAIDRAEADGAFGETGKALDLKLLVEASYILGDTLLTVPAGIQTSPAPWQYLRGVLSVKDGANAGQDQGTAAPDDVLLLSGLRPEVCEALNAALGLGQPASGQLGASTLALPSAQQAGTSEGCIGGNNGYAYFRIINRH